MNGATSHSTSLVRIFSPSLSHNTCPQKGHEWAQAYASWVWARGSEQPGLVISQSQLHFIPHRESLVWNKHLVEPCSPRGVNSELRGWQMPPLFIFYAEDQKQSSGENPSTIFPSDPRQGDATAYPKRLIPTLLSHTQTQTHANPSGYHRAPVAIVTAGVEPYRDVVCKCTCMCVCVCADGGGGAGNTQACLSALHPEIGPINTYSLGREPHFHGQQSLSHSDKSDATVFPVLLTNQSCRELADAGEFCLKPWHNVNTVVNLTI